MIPSETIYQMYQDVIGECRTVFFSKSMEYGPTWAVYRWNSLLDQLWMKIKRIRTLEETSAQIPDSVQSEYRALINYAIIFLMRLYFREYIHSSREIVEDATLLDGMEKETLLRYYDEVANRSFQLCKKKNHDYNNAWQDMSVHSITDLIIIKILRMRNILRGGEDPRPEQIEEQLFDVINYCVFAMILLQQESGDA